MRVTHLPDPGAEPSKLRSKKEEKEKLKKGMSITSDVISDDEAVEAFLEVSAQADAESIDREIENNWIQRQQTDRVQDFKRMNPLEQIAEALRMIEQKETIEVLGPFGKISFKAMHASVNEHGIAFIILKDHMSWEPNVKQELKIRLRGDTYNVIYVGGYFTFKQMPFIFLSFLKLDNDDEQNEQSPESVASAPSYQQQREDFYERHGRYPGEYDG
jgi:hypothetical protein